MHFSYDWSSGSTASTASITNSISFTPSGAPSDRDENTSDADINPLMSIVSRDWVRPGSFRSSSKSSLNSSAMEAIQNWRNLSFSFFSFSSASAAPSLGGRKEGRGAGGGEGDLDARCLVCCGCCGGAGVFGVVLGPATTVRPFPSPAEESESDSEDDDDAEDDEAEELEEDAVACVIEANDETPGSADATG